MLELARLYLTLDEVDACLEQCGVILKNDQFNEDATLVCFVCPSPRFTTVTFFWNLFLEVISSTCFSLDDGRHYVQEAGL